VTRAGRHRVAPGTVNQPPAASTLLIGLTGPIGCGKSTVAGWIAEAGGTVVDADLLARDVTAPGTPGHDAVLAAFGEGYRRPDGTLDRAALGRTVFGDPAALAALEQIVHPLVRPRILAAIESARAAGAPVVALEAIKLVESGYVPLCDEVWLVTCDSSQQERRLVHRGLSIDEARQRARAQAGLVERVAAVATRIIDTSGSVVDSRQLVETALAESFARARAAT
jgi:dephospho-CoA kinase